MCVIVPYFCATRCAPCGGRVRGDLSSEGFQSVLDGQRGFEDRNFRTRRDIHHRWERRGAAGWQAAGGGAQRLWVGSLHGLYT